MIEQNLNPLDDRYKKQTKVLLKYFGEYSFVKYRFETEMAWAKFLSKNVLKDEKLKVPSIEFNEKLFSRIKEIEETTKHDVKALEYAIKEKFTDEKAKKLVHLFCTSEDINSTALALQMKDFFNSHYLGAIKELISILNNFARKNASIPFPAKTHGQAASPTTVGKEFKVFSSRLSYCLETPVRFRAKFSGATGSFHAHAASFPNLEWPELSHDFLKEIGLESNPVTTQIESREWLSEILDLAARINSILLDLSLDIWLYISYGYFVQRKDKGQVGSSTMPHKVNPINFENAEGNLGLSNSILRHMSEKLLRSRMQRDLSCSTVIRNVGVAFGYIELAISQLKIGLSKLDVNKTALRKDLVENYSVLAEAIQATSMRYGNLKAYEKVKDLSQGKMWDKKEYEKALKACGLPKEAFNCLQKFTPENYIGWSKEIAEKD